ncbi:MAG: LysR family transcriptional regulator [Erysipelotrichia bacterium]|nr:LysR family transcriptional regulator [Erysipelotrichia bacterium]
MDLRQLEYFRAVAETGSISEAARKLHLSQPPVSVQMKQLEQELGVSLFERGSRNIILTEAGRILYARSGEILSYADSTKREVSGTGATQILRLGMTPTVVTTMMPYLKRYASSHPSVRFEVHDGSTYQLREMLDHSTVECAALRTPIKQNNLNSVTLLKDDMIAVSSREQHHIDGDSVTLEQLALNPIILYRRYEQLILDAFHCRNLNPDIYCLCDDGRDALMWAEAGLATAIFPGSMRDISQNLVIQTIDALELNTDILLAWRKDRTASELLTGFLKTFVI